jgi:glucose-1-phosphate thymidylyltransferase
MELRGLLVVEEVAEDPGDGRGDPAVVPATEFVANRPIAHHVMDALEAAGVGEVIVVASERSVERVRDCLGHRYTSPVAPLRFVSHHGPIQLASALSLAAPMIEEAPCIVHAAGGLLAEPLAPLANGLNDSDAVLTVHQTASPDERLSTRAQSLLRLSELDPSRSALGVAGVWVFGPGAIQRAAGRDLVGGAASAARDVRDGIDLTVVAERITSAGGRIDVRVVDLWRAYHGEAADLLELNRIVLDGIDSDLPPGISETNRVEGRVCIDESASVTNSVLVGPVVIGRGARISDAYIGPYTAVGPGVRIEGAEIERSIVFADANLSHVGCRMTDSVVGRGSHVFRDFSLPRALRVRVGSDAELGLC